MFNQHWSHLPHCCKLRLEFGKLNNVIQWLDNEIAGDWEWELKNISNDGVFWDYCFYFSDEKDAVIFSLKYANKG